MQKELKNIVRSLRKQSDLSQQELAKLAGVGKTAIFDVEHGKKSIQFDTLLKILKALNIRIEFHHPLLKEETL